MARIVKEYDERYNQFLDVAQQFFFSKGYEVTSVQEIIKAVGVAKGTFYHYFDSKVAILDALLARVMANNIENLKPLVEDETLDALTKFERFYASVQQWKVQNRTFVLNMTRVMYSDENVLLRERMKEESIVHVAPLLGVIIEQGGAEGVFDVIHPLETGQVVLRLTSSLSEAFVQPILSGDLTPATINHVKRQVAVITRSIERVLGMQDVTLTLLDDDTVDFWLVPEEKE